MKLIKKVEIYKARRPRKLSEIVGNEALVETLSGMLDEGSLPHSILLHGPSGCGKTTIARILARKLGCGEIDLQEINSASMRGIDTVRTIAQQMNYAPAGGKARVFIIDEVHQWTKDAQEAALKILEDTPSHVYFMLCTTVPGKLLPTIRSRCADFALAPLTDEQATSLVEREARSASIEVSPEVVEGIVRSAQGGARLALVLLDTVRHLPEKKRLKAVQKRAEEENEAIDLCRALIKRVKWGEVGKILKGLQGTDVERTRRAVLGYARAVLLSSGQHQAYKVICAFENNCYDSGEAGLARAAFESIHGA